MTGIKEVLQRYKYKEEQFESRRCRGLFQAKRRSVEFVTDDKVLDVPHLRTTK